MHQTTTCQAPDQGKSIKTFMENLEQIYSKKVPLW